MVLPRRLPQLTFLKPRSSTPLRASNRSRTWQRSQRRGYASEDSHGPKQASSDWPWAIGAITVTVPCSWYLWPKSSADHGHGHGGDNHGAHEKHEGEESEEAPEEEEASATSKEKKDPDAEEPKDEDKDEGSSSDSESDDGNQDDTPETSDDETPKNEEHVIDSDGGNVEGVRFKGATKGGSKEGEQGDTRKHIPDSKGFNKLRIESDYGNKQGELQEESEDGSDTAAASKPAGGPGSQSNKQEGISNTDTKHSTDITNDPNKSKKGEGTPETSKSKGTVDPSRPQV